MRFLCAAPLILGFSVSPLPTIFPSPNRNFQKILSPHESETPMDNDRIRMHTKISEAKLTRRIESVKQKLKGLGVSLLQQCHCGRSDFSTKIWNLSNQPVELQIRVGSMLKKVRTLKPGCYKKLNSNNIYRTYMPNNTAVGFNSLLYYYDETCHPYIWVHDTGADFSRMVKQQYLSLQDLRDCSEIKIFRDRQRGCIAVQKTARTGLSLC